MKLITRAQIEAAAKAMWLDAGSQLRGAGEFTWEQANDAVRSDWINTATIALTAAVAAQVGECKTCGGQGYLVGDAEWKPYAVQCPDCKVAAQVGEPLWTTKEVNDLSRIALQLVKDKKIVTIERCAQVVKDYIESLTDSKSDFMKKWDQVRHLVETRKGSDLPRLNFESVIETLAEDAAAAIRKLKDE